jgi:hypothetical protein
VATFNLTVRQKNDVFDAIRDYGLDPREFVWLEQLTEVTQVGPGHEPYTVQVLAHAPTGYWFQFDVDDRRGSLWAIYVPGPTGARTREKAVMWESAIEYVREWLQAVAADHAALDLWAELDRMKELPPVVSGREPNTPFTAHEQAEITAKLGELKEYLRATHQRELGAEQLDALEARLDYLDGAASRMGRIDWRNSFVGALILVTLERVIPADVVQDVWAVAVHTLHLFGGGPPPLPMG